MKFDLFNQSTFVGLYNKSFPQNSIQLTCPISTKKSVYKCRHSNHLPRYSITSNTILCVGTPFPYTISRCSIPFEHQFNETNKQKIYIDKMKNFHNKTTSSSTTQIFPIWICPITLVMSSFFLSFFLSPKAEQE